MHCVEARCGPVVITIPQDGQMASGMAVDVDSRSNAAAIKNRLKIAVDVSLYESSRVTEP